jgi:signal transduction histidine kinase
MMTPKLIKVEKLKPRQLKTIYEMSRVILRAVDSSAALEEITRIARPVFIFDNVVLYQPKEDGSLEPIYAKSIGRGRSAEADMAWGEAIAQDVLKSRDIIIRQENVAVEGDASMTSRLDNRFYLGLPLVIESSVKSALVFIRFGGPEYLPEQVIFSQLIAEHIELLLERQTLVNRIVSLEAGRRLDQLQKEFVATVSHDLRSPLGFIKGYTTTLLRDDTDWDTTSKKEFLTIIDEEADRLSRLIDNLFDSSRLQSGTLPMTFQKVKINTFLSDYAQRIALGDLAVELKLDLHHSEEMIWIDPTRMIQVLDNLIANAVKYAPGSLVTLSLRWENELVHICLQDKGPGIPKDQLKSIFKRFYRLPEHRDHVKGSGLGLFICKQIIQAHQGDIYAESILGQGTGFHIQLPRSWVPDREYLVEEEV